MAVYLSPGVYPREIDLSAIPAGQGPLRPAFIGAAKKGPMNVPTLITTGQQYVDTFGEPFPESYLGYAVLAYLQEGSSAYVLRVGVEHQEGMDESLAADAVDTSGARKAGWGRIPVFSGIDKGRIYLREVNAENPIAIHTAANSAVTPSRTGLTLVVSGTYTGAFDEAWTVLITGDATGGDGVDGAKYQISNTTQGIVASGLLNPSDGNAITDLVADYGITLTLSTSSGRVLTDGDYFTFTSRPDNTLCRVLIEGERVTVTLSSATYTTAAAFAAVLDATLNGDASSGADEVDVVVEENSDGVLVPVLRTTDSGKWIQLEESAAFCAEVGVSQHVYDIPRSHLVCTDPGPFSFSNSNNRVVLDVIGGSTTKRLDFIVNSGTGTTVDTLVSLVNANCTQAGIQYASARAFTVPGGEKLAVILSSLAVGLTAPFDQLKLNVSWTFVATMRFAQETGILFPYTKAYRSYWDARTTLPDVGSDNTTPASCDPLSTSYDVTQCALDTDYYANVVGWFVAKTPGTWADGYTIGVEVDTNVIGSASGRFKVTVYDKDGVAVDVTPDLSFDQTETRFIGNVLNAGSPLGGPNGNPFIEWEQRPSYTNLVDDEVRNPAAFRRTLVGGANGIPSDPTLSEALDDAIIGNPALASGLYALGNPESYDFNLLLIPGITSGTVIGQALQFCEGRGDVLYLVDPPFGLRPSQVVEWHNGMLTSDMANAINSSYGALYWGWLKVGDQFNGGTIWVPPSGHVASVFARTARETEQWFAPAGITRGRLLSPIDIEFNPTLGERDVLYGSGNAVNPIVKFVKEGITIWGQRTLQRKATALDRVNVRMLLIFIKKSLQVMLRQYIFEPNDRTTRAQVVSVVSPFLADIAARRGLTAYNVICDETNNTTERIDRNELWVSVFLQPTRAIEFIALNLVVMRTGASFSAQEVLAAGGVVSQ